mgnify:CR=1 FL=1
MNPGFATGPALWAHVQKIAQLPGVARAIERRYEKDKVLELYLNQISLGNGAFGVETASQRYFGKSVRDLDLAEAATLAALPKAPERYNPRRYPDRAIQRRNTVIELMRQEGLVSDEEASLAWNLAARQTPALVVVAKGAADVLAAVRFAGEGGLGVGVMATGHGVGTACDGGVLINTSGMRGVRVDPVARTARVEAGALWTDLIHESQVHGLAGLLGSTSYVGIVGYTMGGGFGWLGRKYGFNAASVREADVVTADGELVRVSAEEHPDLFWGLKGGGGNFGIVTSLKFDLYPIGMLYGGNLIYPVEKAREVLDAYARWSADLPDEMTSAARPVTRLPSPRAARPASSRTRLATSRS